MHKLILLIALLVGNSCFAQSFLDTVKTELCNVNLSSRLTFVQQIAKHKRSFLFEKTTNEFDIVKVTGIFYNTLLQTNNVNSTYEPFYIVNVFSSKDTIIYSEISSKILKDSVEPKLVFFKADTIRINYYLGKHNRKYASTWTIYDFININKNKIGVELDGCGLSYLGKDAPKLYKLVKSRNHNNLTKLATSLDVKTRTLATTGLLFLQLLGEVLSQQETELIQLNQNSTDKFYHSIADTYTDEMMSEFLEQKNVQYLFERFKAKFKNF